MMGRGDGEDEAGRIPGKEPLHPPLPRRFYRTAAVARDKDGFAVRLDGRPVRTPKKHLLVLPTGALADAVAAEWNAQGDRVDPDTMPLTKLANTALDGVVPHRAAVAADIVAYAGSDLLCYRAAAPEPLARRQHAAWDPVLAWAEADLGAHFALGEGVMPVAQSQAALARVAAAVDRFGPLQLAALHVMTTLTGSALLALAHALGRLTLEQAWAAAHVDEEWQVSQWGEDAEAAARQRRRLAEMRAASEFFRLAKDTGG
jgi:chaperone required for assembly of F1-ATPase